MINKEYFKTIDLFAGIGGFRLGFQKAGFKTIFANDFDEKCKVTYNLNFSKPKLTVGNLWDIESKDLPDFDVMLAGFPCQDFSIAGNREGFKGQRGGNLFFKLLDILKEKKPQTFLLENVKNLVTHDNGKTFKIIKTSLEKLGYYIKFEVLNSMMHGNVPQNRERIFIIGFLDKACHDAFHFPTPIPLTNSINSIIIPKVATKYYYEDTPLYARIKDSVVNESSVYQWRRGYVRENKKGVCPTLTANMGSGGHNVPIIKTKAGIRKFTPRECFLLQGFPPTYKLPDLPDSSLYHQVGNSITVTVVKRIAINLKKALVI